MDELLKAKKRYEELIARVDADIYTAEKYKADMSARYDTYADLETVVAVQSQVLRIQDYITQKFNNKVDLLRGYDDICKAIDEKKKEAKAAKKAIKEG